MKALLGLGILALICTGCATNDDNYRGGVGDGQYETSDYQGRYGTSSEDRRFENRISGNMHSPSATVPNMR